MTNAQSAANARAPYAKKILEMEAERAALVQLARDVIDTFKFEFRNDKPINGAEAVDAIAILRSKALAALPI